MAVFSSIPVPFNLPYDSPPTVEGGPDGQRATMTFDIGLNDLNAFLTYVAGTTEIRTRPDLTTYTVVVPLSHPDWPDLFIVGYQSTAFGTPGNTTPPGGSIYTPMYSHARVRVEFATLPFGFGGDVPVYTLSTDHAVAFETVPFGGFVFPNGYRTAGEYSIRVGVTTYVLTTYQSLTPISEAIDDLVGKVNSVGFVDGDRTFAAGTLRFDGVRTEYAQGMYSRTLVKSYTLKRRKHSWQQAIDNTGQWNTPTFLGSGLPKYETGDLNLLKYS